MDELYEVFHLEVEDHESGQPDCYEGTARVFNINDEDEREEMGHATFSLLDTNCHLHDIFRALDVDHNSMLAFEAIERDEVGDRIVPAHPDMHDVITDRVLCIHMVVVEERYRGKKVSHRLVEWLLGVWGYEVAAILYAAEDALIRHWEGVGFKQAQRSDGAPCKGRMVRHTAYLWEPESGT